MSLYQYDTYLTLPVYVKWKCPKCSTLNRQKKTIKTRGIRVGIGPDSQFDRGVSSSRARYEMMEILQKFNQQKKSIENYNSISGVHKCKCRKCKKIPEWAKIMNISVMVILLFPILGIGIAAYFLLRQAATLSYFNPIWANISIYVTISLAIFDIAIAIYSRARAKFLRDEFYPVIEIE